MYIYVYVYIEYHTSYVIYHYNNVYIIIYNIGEGQRR